MKTHRFAALLVLAMAFSAGCERTQDEPLTTDTGGKDPLEVLTAEYGEPMRTYEVRGEVERLPDPNVAGTDFIVRHEAIDDFVNQHGEVSGMHSMSMPFILAEGVELPVDLKKGDKVLISCAQWLEPEFLFLAYAVEPLPADTELTFGRANPPGSDAGTEPTDAPD